MPRIHRSGGRELGRNLIYFIQSEFVQIRGRRCIRGNFSFVTFSIFSFSRLEKVRCLVSTDILLNLGADSNPLAPLLPDADNLQDRGRHKK